MTKEEKKASKIESREKKKKNSPSRRPRPKPHSNPPFSLPIPLLPHPHRASQTLLPRLHQPLMHFPHPLLPSIRIFPLIHNNFPQTASNATLLDRFTQALKPITIRKHRFQKTRRTTQQHFRNTQFRRTQSICCREISLQRPDSFAEP